MEATMQCPFRIRIGSYSCDSPSWWPCWRDAEKGHIVFVDEAFRVLAEHIRDLEVLTEPDYNG